MADLTRLLQLAQDADAPPDGQAFATLYEEIRRLARSLMRREAPGHTLLPTALANEAWLRLFRQPAPVFDDGRQFLAAAVTTLRRILVEHGRRRRRSKRGGDRSRSEIEVEQLAAPTLHAEFDSDRLLALDAALERLAQFDPEKAKLVELRFFGGLTVDEAAVVLEISPRTAARSWQVARAFLRSELQSESTDDDLDT